jgi:hypothetical protein
VYFVKYVPFINIELILMLVAVARPEKLLVLREVRTFENYYLMFLELEIGNTIYSTSLCINIS